MTKRAVATSMMVLNLVLLSMCLCEAVLYLFLTGRGRPRMAWLDYLQVPIPLAYVSIGGVLIVGAVARLQKGDNLRRIAIGLLLTWWVAVLLLFVVAPILGPLLR
jgi:hypothetical protein